MVKEIKTVIVVGASDKRDRYSNMAIRKLSAKGHRVIPIHPRLSEIEGFPALHSLEEVKDRVHTVTLYVGPERSASIGPAIAALKPERVIFNPGTESDTLVSFLEKKGIRCVRACTLVMLDSELF